MLFIRNKDSNQVTWRLINHDLANRPFHRLKPIQSTFDPGATSAELDTKEFQYYKAHHQRYKSELALYTPELIFCVDFIIHPRDNCRQEGGLCSENRGPPIQSPQGSQGDICTKRQNWSLTWHQMYVDVTTQRLAEVSGDRPTRDFLLATHPKDSIYFVSQQHSLDFWFFIIGYQRSDLKGGDITQPSRKK